MGAGVGRPFTPTPKSTPSLIFLLLNSFAAESSKQVQDTHEEYKGLAGFIQTSRKLLNKYNRRELTDKLLIFFGLVLFLSTVLYILKKRLPTMWWSEKLVLLNEIENNIINLQRLN